MRMIEKNKIKNRVCKREQGEERRENYKEGDKGKCT